MNEQSAYQEEMTQLWDDLSVEAQDLAQQVSDIEHGHRHKSMTTGIANEIVNVIKGIVK